ncbi:MAG: hypothetical protein HY287_05625 [Planctomycetes bacterium]|nr:hypothetical protein [Planctomycetota bacterium]MBI3833791.1 hypothetical protein [Planctomycetota bacterium]
MNRPPVYKIEPSLINGDSSDSNPRIESGWNDFATTGGCTFGDQSHCQTYAPILGAYLSDLCPSDCTWWVWPYRATDDFVASESGTITSVCVVGEFLDQDIAHLLEDCSASNPPEDFWVTIYDQVDGMPAEPGNKIHASVISKQLVGVYQESQQFQWELGLGSGVPVSAGSTYWLEVQNFTNPSVGGSRFCDWFWVQASPATEGNGFLLQDFDHRYTLGEAQAGADLAFCLNIAIEAPPSMHPCCTCPDRTPTGEPLCVMRSLADCRTVGGDWRIDAADCGAVSCRTGADAGDTCAGAIPVTESGTYPFNNFCSTTDGPTTTICTGSASVGRDIWFRYMPTCSGSVTIDLCGYDETFDSVLSVYHDPANPTVCPCSTDSSIEVWCSDDDCILERSTSKLEFGVYHGDCYTIRISGYHGNEGYGEMVVGYLSLPLPPIAVPVPQNRYLSIADFNPCTGSVISGALQVKLLSLMHPDPPNLPEFPPPDYSALEGQARWVGPPADCAESDVLHTTFKCASLQAQPVYLNWSDILQGRPLQVTGAEIVPSSVYEVRIYTMNCQGNEDTCPTGPNALRLTTSRWGDVGAAFQLPSPAPLTQPGIPDVAATVDKFKALPSALPVARTDVAPSVPNGRVDISDVASIVDAFKGLPYPYSATASRP